jgi:pyruvate/2-oxoglutarate dehydrogenase complex dihydrolipoamide dehydrogenase (E3) component
LVGAHLLAPGAGETIHELALALHRNLDLGDLASMVHVYPTIATSIGRLAADQAFEGARKWRWLTRFARP